eukprot:5075801-Pyramimonas_sp.AAC.1
MNKWEVRSTIGAEARRITVPTGARLSEDLKCQLEWARKDMGITRLMIPRHEEPWWSSRIRRVTKDLDSVQAIEDRSVNLTVGR